MPAAEWCHQLRILSAHYSLTLMSDALNNYDFISFERTCYAEDVLHGLTFLYCLSLRIYVSKVEGAYYGQVITSPTWDYI